MKQKFFYALVTACSLVSWSSSAFAESNCEALMNFCKNGDSTPEMSNNHICSLALQSCAAEAKIAAANAIAAPLQAKVDMLTNQIILNALSPKK